MVMFNDNNISRFPQKGKRLTEYAKTNCCLAQHLSHVIITGHDDGGALKGNVEGRNEFALTCSRECDDDADPMQFHLRQLVVHWWLLIRFGGSGHEKRGTHNVTNLKAPSTI